MTSRGRLSQGARPGGGRRRGHRLLRRVLRRPGPPALRWPRPLDRSSPAATADGSTDLILDVDLEGRRMHVTCFGPMVPGEPIVLFEAGGGSPSDTWDAVVDALVADAAYLLLRPGRRRRQPAAAGRPGAPPRTSSRTWRVMLEQGRDRGTVRAGGSLDGRVARRLCTPPRTPSEVAGVVLVDPRAPHVSSRVAAPPSLRRAPASRRRSRLWRDEELGAFEHDPSLNPRAPRPEPASAAEASGRARRTRRRCSETSPMIVLSAARTPQSRSAPTSRRSIVAAASIGSGTSRAADRWPRSRADGIVRGWWRTVGHNDPGRAASGSDSCGRIGAERSEAGLNGASPATGVPWSGFHPHFGQLIRTLRE